MLNRRILRVKAFQSLYAYSQCRASNLNLAKDFIYNSFLPDLNSMEVQDKAQLKKEAGVSVDLFVQNLKNNDLIAASDHSSRIRSTAIKAVNLFHSTCKKDLEYLRNNMITSIDRIPQLYLSAIQMLIAFGDHVQHEYDKKAKLSGEAMHRSAGDLNLAENKVLKLLKSAPQFEAAVIRNHAHVTDMAIEIKEWYREYVKP